ncbi:MAG: hypothetical protein KI786_10715 [Mameliella sp.]|nr:hypothetical protein [Phaeodactylibacter sp.]
MKNIEIDYHHIGRVLARRLRPRTTPKVEHDYQIVKRLYWKGFNVAVGRRACLDGNLKSVFNNLVKYIAADNSCEWPLDKGLYLFGQTGVGKTLMLNVANKMFAHLDKDRTFKVYAADKVAIDVNKEGGAGLSKFTTQSALIDDVGIEPLHVQYFGSEFVPIESLVYQRYRRFSNSGLLTHFTSNLGPDEVEERYGTRVHSRISQMATYIFCDAEDKRIG